MKRVISILMLMTMMLSLCNSALAAANTPEAQVKPATEAESTWYYNASGTRLDNTNALGGDAVVMVSKKAESTGTENEFEVELKVSTTQDIREISSGSPDAATLLIIDISSTMDYCAVCGKKDANHAGSGHIEKTRLAAAAEKANELVTQFAQMGDGGKRYMALVVFDGSAVTKFDWLDVADDANEGVAKNIITGLTTGNGTNIEAGLMLGANVWNSSLVEDIDYKYTILLTDGTPTFYVSDGNTNQSNRAAITGTKETNYATSLNTVKDVGVQAQRILNLEGLSRLYSICFGQGVWNDTPFSNYATAVPATTRDMTILEWMSAFSTKAYKAEDAVELYTTFDSIISQIILAAQAWKVDDVMGKDVVYLDKSSIGDGNNVSFADGKLHWDVLASDAEVTQLEDGSAQLDYALRYKVKLDNLSTGYAGSWTDTNDYAKLTYAVLDEQDGLWKQVKPVDFPEPQVLGYEAELEFTKVYLVEDGEQKPISGMKFQLIPVESAQTGETWTAETTSDENGVVRFEGIPSGHSYYLHESNADELGFADLGEVLVTVALGEATSEAFTNGVLVNEMLDKRVALELEKAFATEARPESVTLEVNGPDGYHRTEKLTQGSGWKAVLSGLKPGEYTITEKDAELEGYAMSTRVLHEGEAVAMAGASVTVNLAEPEGELSAQTYSYVFENSYTRETVPVTIEKTFHERVQASIGGEPVLEELDPELYAGMQITVDFVNEKGVSEATVELSAPDWSAQIDSLPTGVYTVEEQIEGAQIPEHDFVHMQLQRNGEIMEGNQLTVEAGDDIALVMDNHYMHHVGHIHVEKAFAGIAEADVNPDKVLYVDVYAQGQTDGEPVTTIEVKQGDDGYWTGTSELIKIGTYTLRERIAGENADMSVDGYTFTGFVFDSDTVVVKEGAAPVFVTLTNTYTRKTDALAISKIVSSPLRSDYDKAFTFAVKLADTAIEGVFDAKVSDGESTFGTKVSFAAGEASVSLKAGQTMTIAGLPEGVAFTVTEESHAGFVTTANGSNANAVKGVIGETNAEFVNTSIAATAMLTVSKTVSGTHASKEDVFTFEVSMPALVDGVYGDMTFDGGKATVQLKHGQKAVATGIPVGAAFTVTEVDYGAYTPQAMQINGTLAAQGAEAAFVNVLDVPVLPETGDESRLLLWGAMLALAGAALMLIRRAKA